MRHPTFDMVVTIMNRNFLFTCCLYDLLRVLIIILVMLIPLQMHGDIFELVDLEALAKKDSDIELYRLQVIRAFDPPLVFRLEIWNNNTQGMLFTKKARQEVRDGELVATKIVKNSHIKVSEPQIRSFIQLITRANFWILPKKDWKTTISSKGEPVENSIKDGSNWVIEGVKGGQYRRLDRILPTSTSILESLPKEIQEQLGTTRAMSEGILVSACIWLWIMGDEADEKIY